MKIRPLIEAIGPMGLLLALFALAPCLSPHPTKGAYPMKAIIEALNIQEGSKVADVGSGDGRLTFPIAKHVGREGRVFAVDLGSIDKLFVDIKSGFGALYPQVTAIQGKVDDPLLPANTMDVILMVISYHEMTEYQAMLGGVLKAMKPGGKLGIIEVSGPPSKDRSTYSIGHFIPEEVVIEDVTTAGFRYLYRVRPANSRPSSFYFMVFEKPHP